ncbi:MAG: hypothetical protein JW839_15695 [Candidatus Lokiarchaeota archaeon]|nr:hypothetical protein [Candidatus Lokiarchaeota archaeon]
MISQLGATAFHGFFFETGVIAVVATMTVLAFKKYLQKGRNKPALLLFMVFLNWTIGVVISWLAKIFTAFLGLELLPITDFGSYMARMVLDFRLLFVFVAVALYCSYVLRVMLFEKEFKAGERAVNVFFLVAVPILCFVLETSDPINTTYTIVVFLTVFVDMLFVYSRFMKHALAQYRVASEKFKGAFKALSIQALFFILTFLNFLLDQVMIPVQEALGDPNAGYTLFYFAAWICAVVGIVLTYYGYIKPRA